MIHLRNSLDKKQPGDPTELLAIEERTPCSSASTENTTTTTTKNGHVVPPPTSSAWSDIKVEAHIGRGAFCMVLKAQYQNEHLAIKCLKESELDSEQRLIATEDLQEEIRILTNLHHPHIVSIHSAGNDPQRSPFFLMECLEDDNLADRLCLWKKRTPNQRSRFWRSRSRRNPQGVPSLSERLSDIGLGLAQALDYLHRQKQIIHCDIKPNNVGFGKDGKVKLFDFGLSQDLSCVSPSKDGHMIGSLRYMAPEVMQAQPVSFGADIYSFSMLLWELTTLERPFKEIKDKQSIIKLVAINQRRLCLRKIKSEPLRCVLRSCWSSNPRMRPSSDRVVNGIVDVLRSDGNISPEQRAKNTIWEQLVPKRKGWLKTRPNVTQNTVERTETRDY